MKGGLSRRSSDRLRVLLDERGREVDADAARRKGTEGQANGRELIGGGFTR